MSGRLLELGALFLKLGCIGFGGPPAHVALMSEEVVTRRGWLSAQELAEGLALCELLPGPASTQLGIYIGYQRAGSWGGLVAGICFIAPAFLCVLLLSWLYFRYQGLPQVVAPFAGIAPVVVALVAAFTWKLGRKLLWSEGRVEWPKVAITLGVALGVLARPVAVFWVLLLAGAIGCGLFGPRRPPGLTLGAWLPWAWTTPQGSALWVGTIAPASLGGSERIGEFFWPLVTVFLRVGAVIFGGGLVIVPMLEFEVVQQLGWLTRREFLDGVAIGQLTPGPVVLTVAFVGYKVAGLWGGLTATVAVFIPSFVFVLAAAPLLRRLRGNRWVQAFLQGVLPGVLGAIAAATLPLAIAALALDRASLLTTAWLASLLGMAMVGCLRWGWPLWMLLGVGAIAGIIGQWGGWL